MKIVKKSWSEVVGFWDWKIILKKDWKVFDKIEKMINWKDDKIK